MEDPLEALWNSLGAPPDAAGSFSLKLQFILINLVEFNTFVQRTPRFAGRNEWGGGSPGQERDGRKWAGEEAGKGRCGDAEQNKSETE